MVFYSMWHRIWENPKNMLLLKNPQFLRNHNETWSKCGTHGLFIFTKFCNDCIKIVDFLIKAYFWGFLKFGVPYCSVLHFLFSVNKTRFVDIYLQFYISINLVESRPILNFRLRPLLAFINRTQIAIISLQVLELLQRLYRWMLRYITIPLLHGVFIILERYYFQWFDISII